MENASKALQMAGEILIGLLVIGVLVYGYMSINGYTKEKEQATAVQQLAEFNREYESYREKLLRGVEVISLTNKAINNNIKYEYEDYYVITVTFKLTDDLAAYTKNKEGKVVKNDRNSLKKAQKYSIKSTNDNAYVTLFDRSKTDQDTFNDFKRRIFKCTKIEYNKFGRIKLMDFEEIQQNLYEGVIE